MACELTGVHVGYQVLLLPLISTISSFYSILRTWQAVAFNQGFSMVLYYCWFALTFKELRLVIEVCEVYCLFVKISPIWAVYETLLHGTRDCAICHSLLGRWSACASMEREHGTGSSAIIFALDMSSTAIAVPIILFIDGQTRRGSSWRAKTWLCETLVRCYHIDHWPETSQLPLPT